jgi:hypothetical protein
MKPLLEFLDTVDPFTNITEIWHAIARIEGKGRKKKRVNLLEDLQKVKEFMDRFYVNDEWKIPKQYDSPCEDDLINLDQLNEIVNEKKSTAPGEDGITYGLVMRINENLKEKLVEYMNQIWRSGNIPKKLKKYNIIAVLKPNKPEQIENLRPISLVPVIMKIMNSMVKKRLMFMLETNKFLPNNSFGFRKNSFTSDCVTFLTNEVMKAKREKKFVVALFVDVKSAFDNVDVDTLHEILVQISSRSVLYLDLQFLDQQKNFNQNWITRADLFDIQRTASR